MIPCTGGKPKNIPALSVLTLEKHIICWKEYLTKRDKDKGNSPRAYDIRFFSFLLIGDKRSPS